MTTKPALLLFDVDGTLTVPRNAAGPEIKEALAMARSHGFALAVVGGSDFKKIEEQLGNDVLERFDYVFSENGLLGFKHGKEIQK